MLEIADYILKPKAERQLHIDLSSPCDERGGFSSYFKGLLAYECDTTIPEGHLAHVCHACHNARCSNVKHLYWGTPSENRQDAISDGAKSIWESMVEKYGEDEARRRQYRGKEHMSAMGKISGTKPKTVESNAKRSKTLLGNRRATNGEITITLKSGEELPTGFYFGMKPRNILNPSP